MDRCQQCLTGIRARQHLQEGLWHKQIPAPAYFWKMPPKAKRISVPRKDARAAIWLCWFLPAGIARQSWQFREPADCQDLHYPVAPFWGQPNCPPHRKKHNTCNHKQTNAMHRSQKLKCRILRYVVPKAEKILHQTHPYPNSTAYLFLNQFNIFFRTFQQKVPVYLLFSLLPGYSQPCILCI